MQKSQPPPFYCHLPFFEFPPLLIENFQPPPQDINDRKSSPPFKKGGAGTVGPPQRKPDPGAAGRRCCGTGDMETL